ncbi:hypothetical protein HK100_002605, partial [Physocladia obscura]
MQQRRVKLSSAEAVVLATNNSDRKRTLDIAFGQNGADRALIDSLLNPLESLAVTGNKEAPQDSLSDEEMVDLPSPESIQLLHIVASKNTADLARHLISAFHPIFDFPAPGLNRVAQGPPAKEEKHANMYVAIEDFDPESHDEIELRVGNKVIVTEKSDENGRWTGFNMDTNKTGRFPGLFVSVIASPSLHASLSIPAIDQWGEEYARCIKELDTSQFETFALPRLASAILTQNNCTQLQKFTLLDNILGRISYSSQLIFEGEDLLPRVFVAICETFTAFPEKILHIMTLNQFNTILSLSPQLFGKPQFVGKYLETFIQSKVKSDSNRDGPDLTVDNFEALKSVSDFVETSILPKFSTPILHRCHSFLIANALLFSLDKLGRYDVPLFEKYISLPRFRASDENHLSFPGWNFSTLKITDFDHNERSSFLSEPYGVQKLLHSMLVHIFRTNNTKSIDSYSQFIDQTLLLETFVIARICYLGEYDKWQKLFEKSLLDSLSSPQILTVDEKKFPKFIEAGISHTTKIPLIIQNISTFECNEYEINSFTLFSNNEVAVANASAAVMDLDLTGIVPHRTRIVSTSEHYSAGRRYDVELGVPSFDAMERGIMVVEVVGGSKRFRAVLKKGVFRLVQESIGVDGQIFKILDEKNNVLESGADLFVAGHLFEQNQDGSFLVPFSGQPKQETAIITYNGFSHPSNFEHLKEEYFLDAHWLFNREAVRQGANLSVAVHSMVKITDKKVFVKIADLEIVAIALTVKVVAVDGLESVKLFENFELFDDIDSVFDVHIPAS